MDIKKFLLAAVGYTLLGQIIHILGAVLSMDYYTDPAYFQIWSKLMMPTAGPPPMEFTLVSLFVGFIMAVLIVYIYEMVKKSLPVKSKIISYATILFSLGSLPGIMMTLLILNVPLGLGIEWLVEGLVINLLGTYIIVKICGP